MPLHSTDLQLATSKRTIPIKYVIKNSGLIVGATATILLVAILLAKCNLGFDFTDQGFYLNTIGRPFEFPISVTQFGYVYHPLDRLLGENVALLRQASLALTFALAVLAAISLQVRLAAFDGRSRASSYLPMVAVAIISAGCALLSLVINAMWLPTPSYNSLVLQSLLITAIGFCLATTKPSFLSYAGWITLGFGGFLTFIAKPTSAAVLALVILLGLWIDGRLVWRWLAIAIVTAALLAMAAALYIAGSIAAYAQELRNAVEYASRLSTDYQLGEVMRVDAFNLDRTGWFCLAGWVILITSIAAGATSSKLTFRRLSAFATFVVSAVTLCLIADVVKIELPFDNQSILQVYALPFATPIGWLMRRHRPAPGALRLRIGITLVFIFMPFAYAFGTNNNYWLSASTAAFFFVLAALSSFSRSGKNDFSLSEHAPVSLVALLMTVLFLKTGMAHPYRDIGTLDENIIPVEVGRNRAPLRVHREVAAYLNALQHEASKAGFTYDTPMIDLTGHYPGALFALGAKPLGAAWLIGGYSGSETVATSALDRVSCTDLANAWILVERNGPRRLPDSVLARYGMNTQSDYTVVATLDSPKTSYPDSFKQELLSPNRTSEASVLACQKARASEAR